ncbi:class F sortase [Virgibacillus sp. DJP39]|uniref:class F sortase n=1 Tax=Virgibacillus sp. DJP39 TaxID=3409790 RepID=UPI003BB4DAF6
MQKIISILFITILVGCNQVQSTNSTKPESTNVQEESTEKQTAEQLDSKTKDSTKETFYANAFDEPLNGVVPSSIQIKNISVEANVEHVGLQKNGKMDVPKNYRSAGWYESGPKPGDQGSAVVAGHVNDPEGKGIFWNLDELEAGDEVQITGKNGETLVFEVVDKKAYNLGEAPIDQIFGYTPRRMLNLITCTGDYIEDLGTYGQRLVVYTELKAD